MRLRSLIIATAIAGIPLLRAQQPGEESAAPSPKDAALEHLLSERSSPDLFKRAIEEARKQGISEQAILEARFIFHVDRQEDEAISAMLPDFLKRSETFRLEESEIFATREDWLAVIEYIRAITALREGNKAGFKTHITEAFWLSPKQGSAFAPHIERVRLEETMATVKIDFSAAFPPLAGGQAVPLSSIIKDNKALLLQFWSPLSAECEASLGDFAAIAAELSENNIPCVTLLLENSEKGLSDTTGMLKNVGEKTPGTWLVDREREAFSTMLRVQNIPALVLISKEGKVLFNGSYGDAALWTALQAIAPGIEKPELQSASE